MKEKEAQVIDRTKFLEFEKNRVQSITLEQLEKTHREDNVYGEPLKGIYHFDMLNRIIEMAKDEGLKVECWDLFAANNRDRIQPGVVLLPQVEKTIGERAVEAHILRRVFANIRLYDMDTKEYTTNLSIAYHQGGIQAGFGNNVIICHNQCMLGASRYAATYSSDGRDKVSIPQLLDTVKSWLCDARQIVETDRQRIEAMKDIQVSAEQCFTLIGMLTAARVARDTCHKEIAVRERYPLNQAQISEWTEDMMLRYHNNKEVTVWDLYDGATNLYKAEHMDMTGILPQNLAMVKFLEDRFGF